MSDGADVTTVDEFERARRAKRSGVAHFTDEDGAQIEPLEFARRKTKLPDLQRVVKHGESNALYDFELAGGERIEIGKSGDLLNPRKVDAALADSGVVIPYWGPKEWRPIAAALLAIAEVEDTGSTQSEETADWLASFARGHLATREVDVESADDLVRVLEDPENQPAFRGADGSLYVRLGPLMRHVLMQRGQKPSQLDVSARLGRLGFTKRQLSARSEGGVVKARYWRSPPGFDPEESA
jgi:hypothetical protein